jgi:hypothetical protein
MAMEINNGAEVSGLGVVHHITEVMEIFGSLGLSVVETDQSAGLTRGVLINVQMTCGPEKLSKAALDAILAEGLRQKGYRVLDSTLTSAPLVIQWESVTDGWEAFIRTGPDRLNGFQVGQKYAAGTPTPVDNVTLPQTAQIYTLRAKPADGSMTPAKLAALGPLLLPLHTEVNRALRSGFNLWTSADTLATVQRIEESNFGLWAGLGLAGALAAYALTRDKSTPAGRR